MTYLPPAHGAPHLPTSVRVGWIPGGHPGIEATVRTMRRIARRGSRSDLLAAWASRIVQGQDTDTGAARAIRSFLDSATRFEPDPPGVELVRSPAYMLREVEHRGFAVGDCDDVATLGAALGQAIGIPARYVLLGFTPAEPYEHVYTELLTPDGAVELDTTRPAQMPPGIVVQRVGYREA